MAVDFSKVKITRVGPADDLKGQLLAGDGARTGNGQKAIETILSPIYPALGIAKVQELAKHLYEGKTGVDSRESLKKFITANPWGKAGALKESDVDALEKLVPMKKVITLVQVPRTKQEPVKNDTFTMKKNERLVGAATDEKNKYYRMNRTPEVVKVEPKRDTDQEIVQGLVWQAMNQVSIADAPTGIAPKVRELINKGELTWNSLVKITDDSFFSGGDKDITIEGVTFNKADREFLRRVYGDLGSSITTSERWTKKGFYHLYKGGKVASCAQFYNVGFRLNEYHTDTTTLEYLGYPKGKKFQSGTRYLPAANEEELARHGRAYTKKPGNDVGKVDLLLGKQKKELSQSDYAKIIIRAITRLPREQQDEILRGDKIDFDRLQKRLRYKVDGSSSQVASEGSTDNKKAAGVEGAKSASSTGKGDWEFEPEFGLNIKISEGDIDGVQKKDGTKADRGMAIAYNLQNRLTEEFRTNDIGLKLNKENIKKYFQKKLSGKKINELTGDELVNKATDYILFIMENRTLIDMRFKEYIKLAEKDKEKSKVSSTGKDGEIKTDWDKWSDDEAFGNKRGELKLDEKSYVTSMDGKTRIKVPGKIGADILMEPDTTRKGGSFKYKSFKTEHDGVEKFQIRFMGNDKKEVTAFWYTGLEVRGNRVLKVMKTTSACKVIPFDGTSAAPLKAGMQLQIECNDALSPIIVNKHGRKYAIFVGNHDKKYYIPYAAISGGGNKGGKHDAAFLEDHAKKDGPRKSGKRKGGQKAKKGDAVPTM